MRRSWPSWAAIAARPARRIELDVAVLVVLEEARDDQALDRADQRRIGRGRAK